MSIYSQNLIKAAGEGYGGSTGYDPSTLSAMLTSEAAAGLASKKARKELELQEGQAELNKSYFGLAKEKQALSEKELEAKLKQIDEQIKLAEENLAINKSKQAFDQGSYFYGQGAGTQQELTNFAKQYGFSVPSASSARDNLLSGGTTRTGTTGTTSGSGSSGNSALSSLWNTAQSIGRTIYPGQITPKTTIYNNLLGTMRDMTTRMKRGF